MKGSKGGAKGNGARCTKGKSCGATCIDPRERCVLELGPLVSPEMGKVSNMLEQRKGPAAQPQAQPQAIPATGTTALPLQELSKRINQAREEYEDAYGTPNQAAAKAKFEKAVSDYEKAKAAPQSSGVEKIQKIADDQKLERLKAQAEEYNKRWADTIGKGSKENTERAWEVRQMVKKEYDDFKKEHDAKYSRPFGSSGVKTTRGLTTEQEERIASAARMTDYRINKRLEERQIYDDATNAKIKTQNQAVVTPFQKMSADEKASLALYGQDGVKFYQQVNQMLRSGQMEDSSPEKVRMAEFISGNLRSGLEKLPPAKVEELGRAVTGNFATGLATLKPGDIIQDKGFGSYTDRGNPVYDQFFRKDQPNAAIRILNPKTAREVAPVMEYTREGEHISLPGTRYKLVDVQEKGVYSRKTGGYIPQYTFEEVE